MEKITYSSSTLKPTELIRIMSSTGSLNCNPPEDDLYNPIYLNALSYVENENVHMKLLQDFNDIYYIHYVSATRELIWPKFFIAGLQVDNPSRFLSKSIYMLPRSVDSGLFLKQYVLDGEMTPRIVESINNASSLLGPKVLTDILNQVQPGLADKCYLDYVSLLTTDDLNGITSYKVLDSHFKHINVPNLDAQSLAYLISNVSRAITDLSYIDTIDALTNTIDDLDQYFNTHSLWSNFKQQAVDLASFELLNLFDSTSVLKHVLLCAYNEPSITLPTLELN